MRKTALSFMMMAPALMGSAALAQSTPKLILNVSGFQDQQPIPEKYAYCAPDGAGKTKNGGNVNPQISWSGTPEGTKSYALIVVDTDVPASFESMNQDDKVIPNEFARQNFYHWVLADIPASVTSIAEGKDSNGITEGGKKPGKVEYGISGQNDYAAKAARGLGGGYDGPCPPWNDERLHHYYFIVYALNVETLGLQEPITGPKVEKAMTSHILAKGEVVGTYTNNMKLLVSK